MTKMAFFESILSLTGARDGISESLMAQRTSQAGNPANDPELQPRTMSSNHYDLRHPGVEGRTITLPQK
ncbi:MAG: hypothetical protein K2W95_34365 [Candidatus Obscuribacterales bacterium]|nr:hypothetical protein [Candidatus Obscuribacterales bacterium]